MIRRQASSENFCFFPDPATEFFNSEVMRNLTVAQQVAIELDLATNKFPSFNSAHEGFAVLKEEVDELWDEVKAKQGARDIAKMRKEAIQVAAMAMRFVLDVCDNERGQV